MSLWLKIGLPIALLLIIAPLTPELDLWISKQFYINGSFSNNRVWQWFFDYGTYPAWIAALIFAFLFFKYKKPSLLYLLTFGLGAGLITQLLFKTFWERPRPVQTDFFGGFAPYSPFWKGAATLEEPMRSMPCGHCTMGFVFFALFFIGLRLKNKTLLALGIFLTLFLGLGLSISRLAVGGHYFSDVLIGALIMWLSAVIVDKLCYP